jgi:hypothetical protein
MSQFQHRIHTDYAGLADRMRKCAAEAEGYEARRTYLLLADHWQRLADTMGEPASNGATKIEVVPKAAR